MFLCYSFALFNIILGSFDFYALREVDPYLGPAFFMLFIFFIFFILVNMFLAIINDTYSEVKSELANQSDDFQISDYFLAVSQARTLLVRLVVVYTVDWFLVRFFLGGGCIPNHHGLRARVSPMFERSVSISTNINN